MLDLEIFLGKNVLLQHSSPAAAAQRLIFKLCFNTSIEFWHVWKMSADSVLPPFKAITPCPLCPSAVAQH